MRKKITLYSNFLEKIRFFFSNLGITEVCTPLLLRNGVNDPNLCSILIKKHGYLQTSPEYEMKKIMSKCDSDVYQICHAFRDKEKSSIHKKEFIMLEWYRRNYNHHTLMQEFGIFLENLLELRSFSKISYHNSFIKYANINANDLSANELYSIISEKGIFTENFKNISSNKDLCLHILFENLVTKKIGFDSPTAVYNYPNNQALLSRSSNKFICDVGERFEIYINGIEVGNGFYEIKSFDEQKKRLMKNNSIRRQLNKKDITFDDSFLNVMKNEGMNNFSGVAVGIDRLFMVYQYNLKKKN